MIPSKPDALERKLTNSQLEKNLQEFNVIEEEKELTEQKMCNRPDEMFSSSEAAQWQCCACSLVNDDEDQKCRGCSEDTRG